MIDDHGIEAIREDVAREIAAGIEYTKEGPMPEISDLAQFVYTEEMA